MFELPLENGILPAILLPILQRKLFGKKDMPSVIIKSNWEYI